ncbi:hypothetical protein ACS7SF_10800 [Ralstonia sp. 25C]|uniref:hypothetical protein n=1 Tax=Ralstonia sp. 25C TaxID=3447363 RepID=UPI003F74E91D
MRSGRRRAALPCGAALVAILTGCAPGRVPGVPAPPLRTPASVVMSTADMRSCPFTIDRVDDHRDAAGLGHLGRTTVTDDGFMRWLADGLKGLPGQTADSIAARHVRVTVLKAYVYGLTTLKSAHLVVRVQDAVVSGEPAWSKVYRGVDNSLNWANGEAEVQLAFHQALDDLKQQIAVDLSARCPR